LGLGRIADYYQCKKYEPFFDGKNNFRKQKFIGIHLQVNFVHY
jgi:hypothetical protein